MESLSARRAWIEIKKSSGFQRQFGVALRKESVDRNCWAGSRMVTLIVALRKESVDRNKGSFRFEGKSRVALRKESVDRNLAWHCISEDVS